MNSKELKKFLEAQKLQTYYLLNKNESFIFFNGIASFEMKYNEDNILLAKKLNYPNSAFTQYDETPNLWLSLAEQMKLEYLSEYKTNRLNMILFLVNSNLVLLRIEEKERLIKAEANLQLEDGKIYKIDKKFISFFAEDLALWTSSEVSSNKIEHELYDKLKDDFIYVKATQLYHNIFEYEILDKVEIYNENIFITYTPAFTWNNNSIYLENLREFTIE
jgi:hypothetical protein